MTDLLANVEKLHTTELGAQRIKRNLDLQTNDVVSWCNVQINGAEKIVREGKNWYVYAGDAVITVNAHSYTIITAHKHKKTNINLYAVQGLVGKIDDVSELREEFVSIFDTKTKSEMAQFGLLLGEHIINFTGFDEVDEITSAFAAVQEWIDGKGKVNYHKARTLAGNINDLARIEPDTVKKKFYRNMAQISCIPHVKFHALWATDFAVGLINMMYPGDIEAVRTERKAQIELLKKEL